MGEHFAAAYEMVKVPLHGIVYFYVFVHAISAAVGAIRRRRRRGAVERDLLAPYSVETHHLHAARDDLLAGFTAGIESLRDDVLKLRDLLPSRTEPTALEAFRLQLKTLVEQYAPPMPVERVVASPATDALESVAPSPESASG